MIQGEIARKKPGNIKNSDYLKQSGIKDNEYGIVTSAIDIQSGFIDVFFYISRKNICCRDYELEFIDIENVK